MYYDRVQLKEGAKHRIRQDGVPSIRKVTLVYLLLASLIPTILQCIYGGPVAEMESAVMQAYANMDFDLVTVLATEFFLSTAGLISMCCTILMSLYGIVVGVGYYFYTMKVARNQNDAGYQDLSYGLNFVFKIILVTILTFIYIFLWSCLFVIPGIIASYRYRMAYYVLIDDPSISASEAIRRSKLLMAGRKMDLFVLDLSFLGWGILAVICSGIGYGIGTSIFGNSYVFGSMMIEILAFVAYLPLGIWLTAYMQIAEVYFYDFARGDLSARKDAYQNGSYQGPYHQNPNGQDDWQNQPPQGGQNPNQWDQNPPQDDGRSDDPWN